MSARAGLRRVCHRPSQAMVLSAIVLAVLAGVLVACAQGRGSAVKASLVSPIRAHVDGVRFADAMVQVPPGLGGKPFDVPRSLTIPAGWSAEVWARVPDARFAVWTPEHDLLASSSEAGQVVELIPGRRRTEPPRQRVIVSGLTGPQGLAFDTLKGRRVLYVAETDQIDRYSWRTNGTVGARTVVVDDLPDTDPTGDDVHRAKSLVVGRDHTIYVTVGSASNATPESQQTPPRATILSFSPNGSHVRVFASGVRNGEGLAFAPDGSLWTAVNERDETPYPFHGPYDGESEAFGKGITAYVDEHPPDELARLTAGRNLGWPYCDPDPDVTPGSSTTALRYERMPFDDDAQTNPGGENLNCATLAPIDRGLPAHSAPLGFNFLQGTAVGPPWSGGAVVAVHGSWDRTPPRAPAVLWLPWSKSKRTLGESITLIGGFQEPSGARWGRPTEAVAGPDGALYVTDDTAGAVYRIGPREGGKLSTSADSSD
jgi:glucose/arabinose dehydrogenase